MNKLMIHFKLWLKWSRAWYNKSWYKVLVLFGLAHSPSFEVLKAIYINSYYWHDYGKRKSRYKLKGETNND